MAARLTESMKSAIEIQERLLGSRCCDRAAHPKLTSKRATELSAAFDILSHPVRLQLLEVLARNEGRVCVCDLDAAVPVKQPTVSHHLKLLRKAGLVECVRQGVWAYYHLKRDKLAKLHEKVAEYLEAVT